MANAEWKDDGRKCHACKGPKWVIQYRLIDPEGNEFITNFHTPCVGGWLHGNVGWRVEFEQGPLVEIR